MVMGCCAILYIAAALLEIGSGHRGSGEHSSVLAIVADIGEVVSFENHSSSAHTRLTSNKDMHHLFREETENASSTDESHAKGQSIAVANSGVAGTLCKDQVPDSEKREGHFVRSQCKCRLYSMQLSRACGSQYGERKFDITKLSIELGDLPFTGCRCEVLPAMQLRLLSTLQGINMQHRCYEAVPMAVPRNHLPPSMMRFRTSTTCKCLVDWYLSPECGHRLHGQRKFNPTQIQPGGCQCISELFSKASSRMWKLREQVTQVVPDTGEEKEDLVMDMVQGADMHHMCYQAVHMAMPRKYPHPYFKCKCPDDWYLSEECGVGLQGERKFNPKDLRVTHEQCRCQSELEQMLRNRQFGGVKLQKRARTLQCAKPFPRGDNGIEFAPGDTVKIVKYQQQTRVQKFTGKQVPAAIHGKIAQVICPGDTPGASGRICLRQGTALAGCWLPANLEKMHSLTGEDLQEFLLSHAAPEEDSTPVGVPVGPPAEKKREEPSCSAAVAERFSWLSSSVAGRDDTLFFVFGADMADSGDHQFVVFRAIQSGGSSTYLVKGPSGSKYGLAYWFAKGPDCSVPTDSTGVRCVSEFNREDTSTGNLPSSAGSAAVLTPGFSTTAKYNAGLIGMKIELVVVQGGGQEQPLAKIDGSEPPCYLKHVHVCRSNGKKGGAFQALTLYIYADTAAARGPGGEECGHLYGGGLKTK